MQDETGKSTSLLAIVLLLTREQLVDAGWKYTPTSDSDDMATCVYCQLALDGWEPNDKPLWVD